MKICAIHGSGRKGNTDRTIEIIKNRLNAIGKFAFTDIYLPDDLPHFCKGCFLCVVTGVTAGENCPHGQYTKPVLEKMLASDGIIIGSPTYALAESAQLKALFDHFACTFICHRPNEAMFGKIGFVVSTAAGAGTGNVIKVAGRNLLYWGIKRTVKCGFNLWEKDWDKMPQQKRTRLEKSLEKKTDKFYEYLKKRNRLPRTLKAAMLRIVFKKLIRGYPDGNPDKVYWKSKGWL